VKYWQILQPEEHQSTHRTQQSAKLTVIAQYWPGSLCHSLIDSSQCSTPLLVSCFRQDSHNMWRHFSATFIGWRFRKESSSVSVFWRTVVYMAPRRRTLPRHYNGPPTCLHVVIFGLPQRRLWSFLRPVVQHLATERFLWLPHTPGTLCRPRWQQSSHWRRSGAAWKQNYSIPALPDCLTALSTCVSLA